MNRNQLRLMPVLLLVLCSPCFGGEYWDEQFGVPGAHPGGVRAVVFYRGSLIVGGNFTSIGGVVATNLAQWDGTNWAALGGGVHGGVVNALEVAGSSLFVGGWFIQVGDLSVNNVARWDGANWSDVGGGVNSIVFALSSHSSNLYAGGHFTMAGTNVVGKVARWDGTNWSGLGLGIVPVAGFGAVDSLATAAHDVYVAGRFRIAGGIAATNIARWDGTNWHPLGNGLRLVDGFDSENGSVNALTVSGGILYAGGLFGLAGTVPVNSAAAWDGSRWSALGGRAGDLPGILCLHVNGSELFAGGSFTNIGGAAADHVARWNGQVWTALGAGVTGPSAGVDGLASTGSELVAVGSFLTAGGLPSTNIALWHIPHELAIQRTDAEVKVSWPSTGSNFVLEACSGLSPLAWQTVPQTPMLDDGTWVVRNSLAPTNAFYRLRRR